ncbi:MAG: dihydrolipoyl dehydrogenase [Deltaproteobacteria bacterium]|nr:dihydrolipoyl dehydrogenase [Deltaproteobacteria bacterium]
MAERTVDAVVIGGGPGGYVAGIRLGQLGVETVVVEKDEVGGVCLNWGCIPSKALIAAANFYEKARGAATMGIKVQGVEVDVPAMQAWKDGIVRKLTTGIKGLLKGNKVDVVRGTATLVGPETVEVDGGDGAKTVLSARRGIILACGARPIELPGFAFDGKVVVHAQHAVSFSSVPRRLAIIGGGVIGLELGMVYAKLGSAVTVVEMMPQLLPGIDRDLVAVVEKKLRKLGVQVHLEASAKAAVVEGEAAKVSFVAGGKEEVTPADKVLVAVGFRPNSENLGLERAGVKVDKKGFVPVDAMMRTNVPSIYAIGDLHGPPLLAHKASKEGEIAAEVIAGKKSAMDIYAMPAAIFTDPEIAVVGLSESEARAKGREVLIGKFPFAASGRAMAMAQTEGFVKVLTDKATRHLVGVGIVGPDASGLIAEAALALEMTASAEDVGLTVHAHPTFAESLMEAVKASLGEAIHVINR